MRAISMTQTKLDPASPKREQTEALVTVAGGEKALVPFPRPSSDPSFQRERGKRSIAETSLDMDI